MTVTMMRKSNSRNKRKTEKKMKNLLVAVSSASGTLEKVIDAFLSFLITMLK